MLKRLAVGFALFGILLRPVSASPDPTSIYMTALTHLRALPHPDFLEYRSTDEFIHNNTDQKTVTQQIERTRDGMVWMRRTSGASPLQGLSQGQVFILHANFPADGFLISNPQRAEQSPQGMNPGLDSAPLIGTVHAASMRYDIGLTGEESTPQCGQTYHLHLTPRGNPERNNLRELWIAQDSGRLCQADVLIQGYFNQKPIPVLARVQLDEHGIITQYDASGSGHLAVFFTYAFRVKGTISDVRFQATEPEYYFDKALWTKHEKDSDQR